MPNYDDTFELVASSVPTLTGGELDQLLARATHVTRSAICITDADIDEPGPRIIYVNPAFEVMTGYRAEEVLGRHPRFLQGPLSDRRVLDRLRADLEAGRPFHGETINYRKDGTPFNIRWRIAALRDATGRVTNFVASQEDITALRQAEQLLRDHADYLQNDIDWLASLVDLGVSLARTSDPAEVLTQVIAAAVETLGADLATIVLVDDERGDWVVAGSSSTGATPEGTRFDPQPDTLISRALDLRRPVIEATATAPVGAGLAIHGGAAAVLPIGDATGNTYGVLALRWQSPRGFRPAERTHLGLLARLTTMDHRKTQALANQHSLATELQGALLPTLGALPGLEASCRYLSVADDSVVGGDWYDAVELPDGQVALFVGDVVGHGAPAAALMGEIRFTTRGLLRAYSEPGTLLDELDSALLAAHPPGEALATTCAMVLSPDGTIRYSAAGHPHPVIRRADGRIEVLDGARSRLLGASTGGAPRPTALDHLAEGDSLVAFSDGVFEIRGQDYDDGYLALVGRLAAAPDRPDGLCDAAVGLSDENLDVTTFRDDVVVLAVRRAASVRSAGPDRPG